MALVFTDGSGRVLYWYADWSKLNSEFASQGIEVPTEQMSPPETNPWERALPFFVEGEVSWVLEELPEDSPEQVARRLAAYELPGAHFQVNP